MSLLEELDISEKIPKELKNNIKYYHVFNTEGLTSDEQEVQTQCLLGD